MAVIALDVETRAFQPGCMLPPLACVSLASDEKTTLVHHTDATRVVGELLDQGHTFVGTNIAFDTNVLIEHDRRLWPGFRKAYQNGRVRCTYVNEILLDIADGRPLDRGGHSLASQAKRHLGVEMLKGDESWQRRFGDLRHLPLRDWPEAAKAYAMGDARVTLAVDDVQQRRPDMLRDQYRQAKAAVPIQAMGAYGVITDPRFVDTYEAESRAEFSRLSLILEQAGILRPGKLVKRKATGLYEMEEGSVDQKRLRALVCEAYAAIDEPVPHVRPKKGDPPGKEYGVAYDKLALRKSGNPPLLAQANRASLVKVLGEEIPILRRGTQEPIHAFFRYLVASGRTGCSNPNLQNRANRYGAREAFVPRPGFLYSSCDYAGLEMATLAEIFVHLFGHSPLAEKLRRGIDVLTEFAGIIRHCSYEEACARKKLKKADLDFWRARQTSKAIYYGCSGGMGAGTMVDSAERAYSVQITIDEARHYKSLLLGFLPELRQYFTYVDSQIRNRGFLVQLYSERIRGGIGFTDGCNTGFQGLGSEILKEAMWDLFCEELEPYSPLYGSHTVNAPHDETILEVPETRAQEAGVRHRDVMNAAAARWLRHVPLKSGGSTLMDHWISAAEHALEPDGSIKVWRLFE